MSDKMVPVNFSSLIDHIFTEYKQEGSIFGIPHQMFYKVKEKRSFPLFDGTLETLIGPAAGPHTQLAQNIISAYLTGGRFFELKTVQIMDDLNIDKPCIDVPDEAYNVEWSQELKLEQSFMEYLKAWMLMHVLKDFLKLSVNENRSFIFNMSVGYSLDGIKSDRVNTFIDSLKDAGTTKHFDEYKNILRTKYNAFQYQVPEDISPFISNSVTLSTMHGCPSEDIEEIAKYLIKDKGLHTFVKLNPTLLGYEKVCEILEHNRFNYIELDNDSFVHDLQMKDALPMLKRLQKFAVENNRSFGIKLSNTLGVNNNFKRLPGDQMYMSGRALFPLTINLANLLTKEFEGNLPISFSGGASIYNIREILGTGIYPVTLVTDLLKPGGYTRLFQIAEKAEECGGITVPEKINNQKLNDIAAAAILDKYYSKENRKTKPLKLSDRLPKFDCFAAPCIQVCPAHQNIPGYIRLVEQERYTEALKLIMESNPLPHITGYICDHKCMSACTRRDYDKPVEIRECKKEAALNGYDSFIEDKLRNLNIIPNNIKAAVIGAGPSGLSAAYYLRKSGFDVTVFEKSGRAGGTVREIIPDFRIPEDVIERDINLIMNMGVNFKFNCEHNFSVKSLKAQGYKYIYVAVGASLPNEFELNGQSDNVYDAIDFLKNVRENNSPVLGRSVAIIGGGNSAMDAARAALRIKGVEKVYIIYRRTKEFMPADPEEFDNALSEGAVFKELLLPVEISGNLLRCRKMILSGYDDSGRRNVVPSANEYHGFIIDSVISAIGEHSDENLLKLNKIIKDDISVSENIKKEKYRIPVDPDSHETCVENVYAGGDALRGPSTVIEAVADGKKAALAILKKESTVKLNNKVSARIDIPDEDEIIKRKSTITSSCLSCDLLCNKCVDVCPNRANVAVRSKNISEGLKDNYQILHLDALCNECGNCSSFCPHDGAPYKDKVTLFSSVSDLLNSTNDGFCFEKFCSAEQTVKYRFENQLGTVTIDADGNLLSSVLINDNDFHIFLNLIKSVRTNYSYLVSSQGRMSC